MELSFFLRLKATMRSLFLMVDKKAFPVFSLGSIINRARARDLGELVYLGGRPKKLAQERQKER